MRIKTSTAPVATTKLLIGPTTEVKMSSSTGFLKFRGSTGVGLAQPITGRWVNHRNQRQQYGSDRIDVLDGIQRNSAQHSRGRIATAVRHPGVRRLVDADRKQKNDQLKQDVNMLQVHQALKLILTRRVRIPAGCGRASAA